MNKFTINKINLTHNKVGTNQYKTKNREYKLVVLWVMFWLAAVVGVRLYRYVKLVGVSDVAYAPTILLSPLAQDKAYAFTIKSMPDPLVQIDTWIGKYVDTFSPNEYDRALWRYQLHCIAFHESTDHESTHQGDGGIALGLMQYHMPTWVGFRKQMIKEGWTNFIGSPFDDQEAIATTAWAWSTGHQDDWGTLPLCDK